MKIGLGAINQKKAAVIILAAIALIFILPIFSNFSYWGANDWDQHMLYHGSARISLLKYHQFPLWNPFYCGGNVLLANPQSPFLSPFFLFVLIFGTVAGLKLEIVAYLILGMAGMWLLARQLDAKGPAAYLAPIIFMLSSWYPLHVQAGHTTFFSFGLVPWALLFYIKALKKWKLAIALAVVLTLMILSGGIYPFYFTLLLLGLYGMFEAIESKKAKPIVVLTIAFAFTFLFASVKLVPMLELVTQLPAIEDKQLNSYSMLSQALFSREQETGSKNVLFGRNESLPAAEQNRLMHEAQIPWGWHEYGAYIGIIPLIFMLASMISYRKNWKLIVLAAIFLTLSLGSFAPIGLWSIMQKLPLFGSLHGPSRLLIMFVFCAALLAAKAASDIKLPKKSVVLLALLVIVAADLVMVSRPILSNTFIIEPLEQEKNTYLYTDYIHVYTGAQYNAQYIYMLYNFDTVNCYERLHPKTSVAPQFIDSEMESGKQYSGFIGNAYIDETNQSLNLSYFSPNRMSVDVSGVAGQTVVLSQNYLPGWKAEGKEVFPQEGNIAAVAAGTEKINFYYRPASFMIGTVMSLLGLVAAGLVMLKLKRR